MITKEMIRTYMHFNGDIDGWVRVGTPEQKAEMKDRDWFLIDEFIQDICLVKKRLASEVYMKSIEERLQESCDGDETINEIKKLA